MMDDKDQDRIERLLRGELSAEEESSLQADAKASDELAQELEFAQDLDKVVGAAGRASLKERLQQLEQSQEQKKALKVSWRRPLAIAASVLLLLGMAAVWYANTAYSNQALLTAYYETPNFSGTRSAGDASAWEQITAAFYGEDYASVVELMEANLTLKATEDGKQLLAHTYLQSDQIEAALEQVESLSEGPTKDWLQILTRLAAGQNSGVEKGLNKIIASSDHPYYQDAIALKRKISSVWRLLQ